LLRRGGSLISSLERDCGVADLGWLMLPRVLRSRRAVGMEEEEAVEIGGCAARADRRVGEGIARPRPAHSCVISRYYAREKCL
jgi:hypothetical protein